MEKVYIAIGSARDGGTYFYTFDDETEAKLFVNQMYTQELPDHDAFNINWHVIPQSITNASHAVGDMVEWAKQIHLRNN
jgi:hypothetical protein